MCSFGCCCSLALSLSLSLLSNKSISIEPLHFTLRYHTFLHEQERNFVLGNIAGPVLFFHLNQLYQSLVCNSISEGGSKSIILCTSGQSIPILNAVVAITILKGKQTSKICMTFFALKLLSTMFSITCNFFKFFYIYNF